MIKRRKIVIGIAMAGVAAAPIAPAGENYGADVTLATDYVSRGVSQTLSRPALQGSLWLTNDRGWTAYAWASNVDYVADGEPDDGARVELDLVLEYERVLSERLTATFGRIQYYNPGVDPGYDYDYAEWIARLTLDERHSVSAAHTDDLYGSGARALYLAAATEFELPAGLRLELEVGRFDVARRGAYHHASLALSGDIYAVAWQLAWHVTDSEARSLFYPSVVEPRAVLSVSYTVF